MTDSATSNYVLVRIWTENGRQTIRTEEFPSRKQAMSVLHMSRLTNVTNNPILATLNGKEV